MTVRATVAEVIAEGLAAHGVRRVFGIPGGGSSLELIEAFRVRGLDFVLTHTETAAAIMAAVTAELTGAPGVVVTGLGPGAASVVNGLAYAALDRAPLLVITDAYAAGRHDHITHQRIDHGALFAPLAKGSARATPDDAAAKLMALLDVALAPPQGPVHLDLAAADATAPTAPAPARGKPAARPVTGDVESARALLAGARRPAIVAGLQTRGRAGAALDKLAARLACPVMTTYKAKGVIADDAPRHAGLFTGGKAEAPWLAEADLLVLLGLDPVELIAAPWPYSMPVIEIAETRIRPHYTEPAAALFGPLAEIVDRLDGAGRPANWSAQATPLALPETDGEGVSPVRVVRALVDAAPAGARLAVDAGAHMLPAMSLWPARRPYDLLISNGLSTMGFALPAAIAAVLHEPERRAVAVTGDGGLAMCLGELATAARARRPLTVVLFNDAALSMIDLKQQQRGFATEGVRFPAIDFAAIAEGAGCRAWRVREADSLGAALAEACACPGPALVDVAVDPAGYRAQFEAIRGAPGAAGGG